MPPPPDLNAQLWSAVQAPDAEGITALVREGADPNARSTVDSSAPLHWAAQWYRAEYLAVVEALLAGGAAVDTVDSHGNTPLMIAARHGRTEVARVLLASAADASLRNRSGDRAGDLARRAGHAALANQLAAAHDPAARELLSKGPVEEKAQRVFAWLRQHEGRSVEVTTTYARFRWQVTPPLFVVEDGRPSLVWDFKRDRLLLPLRETYCELEEADARIALKLGFQASYEERSGDVAGVGPASSREEADYWNVYVFEVVPP